MSDQPLYRLAETTAVEALVDGWVAWPHTFSPVVYCMHQLNYQKKTLASYIQNPAMHIKSSSNPKLLGGAFVNIPIKRLPEVRQMLEHLESEHQDDLTFAQALIDFQNWLQKEVTGQSLNDYYQTLPDSLQGYVELLYDYHSRPIVRCIESLLYRSKYYKKHLQSLHLFTQTHDRMRAYYMSTPRLAEQNTIEWSISFDNSKIDELFRLDSQPQPLDYIRQIIGLAPEDDRKLLALLSDTPPKHVDVWQGKGIRIRYYGHASVLVEFNGKTVLIDPFLAVTPSEGGIERFTFQDLPPNIDYVLITHGHHDHFIFETLLRIRHKIGCLVVPKCSGIFYADFSLRLMARALGFKNVVEVEPLDSIAFDKGEIVSVPFLGEHNDLPFAKTGWLIQAGEKQILFAADSNCLDKRMYENICVQRGPIDVVFLGMEYLGAPLSWVYGPLLPKLPGYKECQSRRSNGSDSVGAMNLLEAVQSKQVYVYAIGREPWLQYFMALEPEENDAYIQEIDKLLAACKSQSFIDARRLYGKDEIFLVG